jgi:chemotaxis protein methyltransferase CheR
MSRSRLGPPACATGEEAYSLAMPLSEEIARGGSRLDFRVLATDVSAEIECCSDI